MKPVCVLLVLFLLFSLSAFSQTTNEVERVANLVQTAEQDTIYHVAVETLPEPIGGIAAIQERVKYPEIAKRAGIQGTVYVEVFLDENGNVVRTNIVKGVPEDKEGMLSAAAQEAVKNTKFTPGMQHGKPVRVRMSIPIRFRLSPVQAGARDTSSTAAWRIGFPHISATVTPTGNGPVVHQPPYVVGQFPPRKKEFYPSTARKDKVEGTVVVEVVVDQNGRVESSKIVQGVREDLDKAALEMVEGWSFTPAVREGTNTKSILTIPIRFRLQQ